jgi:hypothetical protein
MKDSQGQVVSLVSVAMCGLNTVNGSRGVVERSNIANYAGANTHTHTHTHTLI